MRQRSFGWIDILVLEGYSLDMGRFVGAAVLLIAVLMVVVPVLQLMSPVSSTVLHEVGAKTTTRLSTSSRVPAVTGDTTLRYGVVVAFERVALLDGPVSLPGFSVDLFVPPRA